MHQSYSQSATGSWYGKADVLVHGNNSNYLTELILKQKGNTVEGIFGYYFKDSYQSFFVRGTYNSKSREVRIKNLPVIFYGSSTRNGIECPMHFFGLLMVSKVSSTLRGSFYTDDKYKYTCPELRVSYKMDESESNQDSILRNTVAGKKFWKPQEEDFIVTTPTNSKPRMVTADITSTVNTSNITRSLNNDLEKALVANFEKRKNTYGKDLIIESDSVRVSFYDNGDIDGDSISVFLNSRPVLAKQEITSRALNVYLELDSTKEVNEISMYAENLGKYPPNTALMIVTDGVNRYEIYLSSNLTQNATVRLRKKK
jgi:hypothetical protein